MLQDRVAELAKITQTDINLFVLHPWGEELFSSESYIYDKQLLSRRINPYVRMLLVEQGQSRALLNEQVGQVSFHVAYAGIKPAVHDAGGAPVAVVGIPFNGSKYEYEKQALDVLANVIQVFAVILLALLPLSYVSVRSLTAPLRLIQQKLRKVSFQNRNEPIEYVSDDEIGMLVNEYNKMLVKLEQSREALSQSEKESAWREMAKQVAHEIKNPLTPMKLNLQQLQRVLDANHPLAKRSIEMLITQIDTLSDIASSFSAFARMPVPKEEPIDLCAILQETLTLNEAREEALITCRFEAERLPVIGDARLMSRIFNNLIINAVQAVPAGRQPEIEIEAKVRHGWAFLRFSDNGAGIPEEARPKVFFPNFTTKSSGSGIGLAIAKRGIETLNGRIWFETETGKGTVFFIEMPMIAD
jgi:nitrogen fixation/metabolism regulation signal transduction histidine kinase